MPRDYKHRVQSAAYKNRKKSKNSPNMVWRWLLVAVLIAAFIVFLNMISNMAQELISGKPETGSPQAENRAVQSVPIKAPAAETERKAEQAAAQPAQPEEPRYDFYTILPQAEVVVPDYEIKTRVREELVGKTKAAKYVMQAGSFREASEADRQKAKLALLGIEARVEKAKVSNVIWHRVKIGPYENPSSVTTIKELLQKNGFAVIVTEGGK
ncbi:MAG: SPOR domain-containing protein [Methylococcales bacterium]|nr:SPOR domain-containing protein [Methylococcales bacterium]